MSTKALWICNILFFFLKKIIPKLLKFLEDAKIMMICYQNNEFKLLKYLMFFKMQKNEVSAK